MNGNLALVPPDPDGIRLSRYSFLSEELREFIKIGLHVHTVSPYRENDLMGNGFTIHSVPKMRNVITTLHA